MLRVILIDSPYIQREREICFIFSRCKPIIKLHSYPLLQQFPCLPELSAASTRYHNCRKTKPSKTDSTPRQFSIHAIGILIQNKTLFHRRMHCHISFLRATPFAWVTVKNSVVNLRLIFLTVHGPAGRAVSRPPRTRSGPWCPWRSWLQAGGNYWRRGTTRRRGARRDAERDAEHQGVDRRPGVGPAPRGGINQCQTSERAPRRPRPRRGKGGRRRTYERGYNP